MNIDNVFIVYKSDWGRVEVEEERICTDMLTRDHFFQILCYISLSLFFFNVCLFFKREIDRA